MLTIEAMNLVADYILVGFAQQTVDDQPWHNWWGVDDGVREYNDMLSAHIHKDLLDIQRKLKAQGVQVVWTSENDFAINYLVLQNRYEENFPISKDHYRGKLREALRVYISEVKAGIRESLGF